MLRKTERYFKNTYDESRDVFRNRIHQIKEKWPHAELSTHAIGQEHDNTIDMIYADALKAKEKVVFFTTGEHGIEGYAGAAVIQLFMEEYLDEINPETTGICLVHAVNPWGMRHFRRVTENNVDLNRNFFYHSVPEDVNKKYEKEEELFLPKGKIEDLEKERVRLYTRLAKAVWHEGYNGVKEAKGMGQYEFERGVHFGGHNPEPSTEFMKGLQRKLLAGYLKVVHMDWHTALGPTNQETIVVSDKDGRSVKQLKADYQLNNIQQFSGKNVKGDSTDYFHTLRAEEYPEAELFSALIEFGTFGESKKAEVRELQTIILENHLYWEGAEKEEDRAWILAEFRNMFYPDEEEWRSSVLNEARSAIDSVLTKEEVFKSTQMVY